MTLDDRLVEYKMGFVAGDKDIREHFANYKLAILSDLNTIIGEDTGRKHFDTQFEAYAALVQDELRQELREKVKEYCK